MQLIYPNEKLFYGIHLDKYNPRNTRQMRLFLLTDKAIYNIKPAGVVFSDSIQRRILLESQDEIRKCIWWLLDFYEPTKSMRNLTGSYGLKFLVEKYYDDYVSNGSFITAAKYLRLKSREFEDDPNIYLPFNKNKLTEYRKKYFNPYREKGGAKSETNN